MIIPRWHFHFKNLRLYSEQLHFIFWMQQSNMNTFNQNLHFASLGSFSTTIRLKYTLSEGHSCSLSVFYFFIRLSLVWRFTIIWVLVGNQKLIIDWFRILSSSSKKLYHFVDCVWHKVHSKICHFNALKRY